MPDTSPTVLSEAVSNPMLQCAIDRATDALLAKQNADGGFEEEVIWCPAPTAQIAIARIATGTGIEPGSRADILKHFAATRRPDGGWGLHPESRSYRFVTVLVYVAARLMGVSADDDLLAPAREIMTATSDEAWGLPSWGKFWLSLLGIYDRRDLHPVPPEIFLLPHSFPFSPYRFYSHTRYIYLAMAYLWGRHAIFDIGPIATDLRREIFGTCERGTHAWQRYALADPDVYVRPGRFLRAAYGTARAVESLRRFVPGANFLRGHALEHCRTAILFEQTSTNFHGISPVSSVLSTLALWFDAPGSSAARKSLAGLEGWAWRDETDGLRYAGARSAVWDTAFALQALCTRQKPDSRATTAMHRASRYLASLQIAWPLPGAPAMSRDPVEGGWCFGSIDHRWPVSDCTAEALSAIHAASQCLGTTKDEKFSLQAAVQFMLDRQNRDGGFSSYERRRGGVLLEHLNPSEMFGECMTERSYIECTGSCLRALAETVSLLNEPSLCGRVSNALQRGREFLLSQQSDDGSWPGYWGINRIYGTLFALWGLRATGVDTSNPAILRAASWLRSIQRSDGAWGEHFSGCLTHRYVAHEQGRIASTSWGMLAMLAATEGIDPCLQAAAAWLIRRQEPVGGWPHDGVNGVFFGTAMLDYRLYNSVFPLWALADLEKRERQASSA